MHLELCPVTAHLRAFLMASSTTEDSDPYDGIMTVSYLNKNTVYISGALARGEGVSTMALVRKVKKFFNERGVTEVLFEKNNKRKSMSTGDGNVL